MKQTYRTPIRAIDLIALRFAHVAIAQHPTLAVDGAGDAPRPFTVL